MKDKALPRVLVIDDFYGRTFQGHKRNTDREDLCFRMGLKDITGDERGKGTPETVPDPLAEAVFYRGQTETNESVENDLAETLEVVRSGWRRWPRWALVLLDLHFKTGQIGPDGEPQGRDFDDRPHHYFGLTILENLQREFPQLPVVILSSRDREEVSLDFSKLGAANFLDRNSASREHLTDNLWRHGLIEDTRELDPADDKGRISGHSIPLLLAWREARRQAAKNSNLLILGETGTGKEIMAQAIHNLSARRDKPFVSINCGALSRELLESELFGHERGSFTGASSQKLGKFEFANGGTVLLDEIGEMPPDMQVALLRVLQEREITRVGGNIALPVDVRVIAATNRDLKAGLSRGNLRADLYYRLSDMVISMPPLRERREDIPSLVQRFLEEAVEAVDAQPKKISEEAMKLLEEAPWPGNVRELQKVVKNAVVRYPDVEYLVPVHLDIEAERIAASSIALPNQENRVDIGDIDSAIRMLEQFRFSSDYADLQGRLVDIQRAYARFIAGYLKSALTCPAIRRVSPKNPAGENNVTGAIRCLTGQARIRTSKAYDILFQLLEIDPDIQEEIQNDPVLGEAYRQAFATRRSGARKNGSTK